MSSDRAPQLPLGTYLRITGLDIEVGQSFRPSRSLALSIDHPQQFRKDAVYKDHTETIYTWALEPGINLFPRRTLLVHVLNSRMSMFNLRAPTPGIVYVKGSELLSFCLDKRRDMDGTGGPSSFIYHRVEQLSPDVTYKLIITFELRYFLGMNEALSDASILHTRIDVFDGIKSIEPFLDRFGGSLDIAGNILKVVESVSDMNPIAKAVVTALSVPFKLLENERDFDGDLTELGHAMHALLMCVKAVRDNAGRSDVLYETLVKVMESTLEAAQFVNDHLKRNRLEQLVVAQFRATVGDFVKDFNRLQTEFHLALSTSISEEQTWSRERGKLREILDPAKHRKSGPRCMPGTRQDVFTAIDSWLLNPDAPNILWLTGAAGAGKSTIASTVLYQYRQRCAWFFFKPGHERLADPLAVWPTIAFDLVEIFPGVRQTLSRAILGTVPEAEVESQFDEFIKRPLIENQSRISSDAPIVIIDGLDEIRSHRQWSALLGTLRKWSELPREYRLIVSSQEYPVIEKELGSVCGKVRLQTGEFALFHESTMNDMRHFFQTRLADTAARHELGAGWPGKSKINMLIDIAGGVFLWAETATNFIDQGNCQERLADVLTTGTIGDADDDGTPVDHLYEKVLNHCFQGLTGKEEQTLRLVLAIIVLAKDTISPDDLRVFVPDFARVRSFIGNLGPVISLEGSPGGQWYRICHLSFSMYVQNSKRSHYTIDVAYESFNFARTCLTLMNEEGHRLFNICPMVSSHCLNSETPGLLEYLGTALSTSWIYSCQFWAYHILDIVDNTSYHAELAEIMRPFLEQFFLQWLELMSYLKYVRFAPGMLLPLAEWIHGHDAELSAFLFDGARFVMTFMEPISQSAPHIYLSALPLSPLHSVVAQHFRGEYPNTLSVITGRLDYWPRLRLEMTEHDSTVCCATFSSDGQRILSGSADGTIRMRSAMSGIPLLSLRYKHVKERGGILAVAFHPDSSSSTIAWLTFNGKCCVADNHNIDDYKSLRRYNPPLQTNPDFMTNFGASIAFSPDGTHLVFNYHGRLHRYDNTRTLLPRSAEKHDRRVLCFAFSPAYPNHIVTSCTDGTLRFWDVNSGMEWRPRFQLDFKAVSLSIGPDGDRFAVTDGESIHLGDVNMRGSLMTVIPLEVHKDFIRTIAFSRDGKWLVSGSEDALVCVWDAATGILCMDPLKGHKKSVHSVAFSPDGNFVVSASADATIRLWDVTVHDDLESLAQPKLHNAAITTVAYSRGGQFIATGSMDGTVRLWDADSFAEMIPPIIHGENVTSVAFSPQGEILASAGYGRDVCLWNSRTGEEISPKTPLEHGEHCTSVECVTFFPEGERVVSGDNIGQIFIWDLPSGEWRMLSINKRGGPVKRSIRSVVVLNDNRRVVAAAGDVICMWDVNTGVLLTEYPHHLPVLLDPDSMDELGYLTTVDGTAEEEEDDEEFDYDEEDSDDSEYHPSSTDFIYTVAANGNCIISGGRHSIRVWNAMNQLASRPSPAPEHTKRVNCLQFSSYSSDQFVSGSSDGSLRMWSVGSSGSFMGPLESSAPVLAISTKGNHLVSGSSDASLRLWDVTAPFTQDTPNAIFSVKFSPEGIRYVDTPQLDLRPQAKASGALTYAFLDAEGLPVFEDSSKMIDGWVYASDGQSRLFWVPPESRAGLYWPRNHIVLEKKVMKLDFSKFYHGMNWAKCRKAYE
ncbi:unnamed protein product [Somion occarium]|uniref:Nephrocystin 3-like N-terminal domain-containing protein n=1 Tax=Somion occarium TaxID=3059160 RepID=A0ABP1DFY2_9APHY